MGIIETKLREAFTKFKISNNAYQLALDIANTTDYSVRYNWQIAVLTETIEKLREESNGRP